ncbi:DUF5133 domain-containing protein [Streptomyces purpurascens]
MRRSTSAPRRTRSTPCSKGTVRTTFEDSGYTLCVLMGKRCAREAADAAERYLRTNQITYLQEQQVTCRQEQNERPRPATAVRRRPPAAERRYPAGR